LYRQPALHSQFFVRLETLIPAIFNFSLEPRARRRRRHWARDFLSEARKRVYARDYE
jgi:hypothetical protein